MSLTKAEERAIDAAQDLVNSVSIGVYKRLLRERQKGGFYLHYPKVAPKELLALLDALADLRAAQP